MHILSLVTGNNPSCISGRKVIGHRNYFMINLHESMGLGVGGSNLGPLDLQSEQSDTFTDCTKGPVPRYHEEESQNSKSQDIRKTIKANHPALSSRQDDCKTRKDTSILRTGLEDLPKM